MRPCWIRLLSSLVLSAVCTGFTGSAATARTAPAPLVLTGGTIWPAPDTAPIEHGALVVSEGRIVAVGSFAAMALPAEATFIDCTGQTIVAGFWNSHVHFTEPKWSGAATRRAPDLETNLRDMLTAHGFTTAVDLASLLSDTLALRRRIDSGEIAGPRILTAGTPIYPTNGVPYYVTENLPPEVVATMPAPATAEEAEAIVAANHAAGADLLKLFLVTGVRDGARIKLVSMDPSIARRATAAAHRLGQKVVVHPSSIQGVDIALDAGVDALAHATQDPENLTAAYIDRLIAADIAMIPTLALFRETRNAAAVRDEVRRFAHAGGRILFGTDVGFLDDYAAMRREFDLLADAGFTPAEILAALTTTPAAEFGAAHESGRIAEGYVADVVVLDGTPADGAALFTRVNRTIRAGRTIYVAPAAP